MTFSTLTLILAACIMMHVTEEFLFPGGFIEWYKEFRPALAAGIKPGYIVWINALMIGICNVSLYLGPTVHGATIWYTVAAIGAINACFHIIGVFSLKKYSPGVVTGVLLYIPLFIYGSWYLLSSDTISLVRAGGCIAAAIAYHVVADKGHKAAADKDVTTQAVQA
jgi:hypothetical protein